MSKSIILSHFHKKRAWMASHVESAQFPTLESKEGLRLYKAAEAEPVEIDIAIVEKRGSLIVYEVDCHPLMVRYAKTLSLKWPEHERETLIAFLSQLSLTDLPLPEGMQVQLFVGMLQGAPVATGMLVTSEEVTGKVIGIYDVFGLSAEAENSIRHHLYALASEGTVVGEL